MANFWFKLKLWTKATLVGLLALYVILFTYFNAQEKVQFWYWFHHQPETNLLLFVLCTFFAGVIAAILAQTMFRTLRQVREMKMRSKLDRLDRDLTDRKVKAAMLQTRETPAAPAPAAPPPPIESLESRRQI
jgi:uncharacterized membrane protein YciS (DUF1049 family)